MVEKPLASGTASPGFPKKGSTWAITNLMYETNWRPPDEMQVYCIRN